MRSERFDCGLKGWYILNEWNFLIRKHNIIFSHQPLPFMLSFEPFLLILLKPQLIPVEKVLLATHSKSYICLYIILIFFLLFLTNKKWCLTYSNSDFFLISCIFKVYLWKDIYLNWVEIFIYKSLSFTYTAFWTTIPLLGILLTCT